MNIRVTGPALLALSLAACAPGDATTETESAGDEEQGASAAVFAVDISLWSGEVTDSEVRCWWDQGVRHVVAGTQNPRITRQQLDMAKAGGMTVDLYVYLYWNQNMAAQVGEALALAAEYPEVGRLWLDVEESPGGLGASALKQKVGEAVEACGEFPCGIYTGKGFWQSSMGGTTQFAHVPLWYAWYDLNPSMSTWATQKFGGWAAPTAKQWQETYFCGIDVDKNTMLVDAEAPPPPAEVPPDGPGAPAAPTKLYPDDLLPIETSSVRMIAGTVQQGVTKYTFEVQSWNGSAWVPYFTYQSGKNAYRFSPALKNRAYRFRVRALDGSGWGSFSSWGEWAHGKPTKLPPGEHMDPPTGGDPQPDPEPQPAGAPTGLTPPDGATIATSAVALGCWAVDGATQYAFEVEWFDAATQSYKPYYTYTGSAPARTFYPQYHDRTYRWRVRAQVSGSWTPNSNWASFSYL